MAPSCRSAPSLLARLAALALMLAVAAPHVARASMLEVVESQHRGVNGVTGLAGVLALVVSADGRNVYAAGTNDDSVVAFARDPATGALTFLQALKDGTDGIDGIAYASSLALSPDGQHLYVTGSTDDAVALFARDASTGALTFIESQKNGVNGVDGLKFARSVAVSPDGSFVYVAGQADDAIAIFRRNGLTGWLSFVDVVRQGVNGATGVGGPLAVAISPDGANLYVASGDQSAVTVFKRDAGTGRLQLADIEAEGAQDFGLSGIHSVTVSADGAYVYATDQSDNAVATFSRNKRTGALTFEDVLVNGIDGVEGLGGALWVAVTPDGTKAFVASTHDNVVAAFERDTKTGALTYVEKQDGGPTSPCLAFARGVAVSPDGKDVYVAGASSNAIGVFRIAQ
jgi:6-phosphogluconolactonase (cycloisomerase 2 family)